MSEDLIKYGVTPKQKKVMDFIKSYIKKNSYSPSYEEIKKASKFKAKSHVNQVLNQLKDRNVLTFKKGKSRSVVML